MGSGVVPLEPGYLILEGLGFLLMASPHLTDEQLQRGNALFQLRDLAVFSVETDFLIEIPLRQLSTFPVPAPTPSASRSVLGNPELLSNYVYECHEPCPERRGETGATG